METKKIRFRDLSWTIKTAIIAVWVALAFNIFAFLIGFIAGVISFI